jgi:hypothetical protein
MMIVPTRLLTTYTLMALQQQPDGSVKVLDSKTVDVVLTKTSVIER